MRDAQSGDRVSHTATLVFEVTVLVLAIFLGFEVISKVPTMLHTPLMSGTNAIHGIVIVGAMIVAGTANADGLLQVIGFVAMVLASANVVGGFVVTDRMLEDGHQARAGAEARRLMGTTGVNLLYLVTIVCFVLALRFLSSPATARRGNQIGAVGMVIAIVATLLKESVHITWLMVLGAVLGGAFGAVAARRVRMTAMPQEMVALFNGVGGGATRRSSRWRSSTSSRRRRAASTATSRSPSSSPH